MRLCQGVSYRDKAAVGRETSDQGLDYSFMYMYSEYMYTINHSHTCDTSIGSILEKYFSIHSLSWARAWRTAVLWAKLSAGQ